MPDEATRLRLADDVAHQSLGPDQETVVLSLKSGYLYTCNETAAAFLRALDGKRTVGEVLDQLEAHYEVERDELRADMLELAALLLDEGLAIESAQEPPDA